MASTVRQNFEQLSYNSPALSQHSAQARVIIGDSTATRTLLAKESGALCLFDLTTGVTYTLPTPVIGMTFEFMASANRASGNFKFITSAATELLTGIVSGVASDAATAKSFVANGSTHRAVTCAGTTTGGFTGDRFKVTAISSLLWLVEGVYQYTGTAATPLATS